VTEGVRVHVTSQYLPSHSSPVEGRYAFAYTVEIANQSARVVQLRSRHWVVSHGDGHVENVRGPGVVGEQPVLAPGESFRYTSGCIIRTPRGTMHGTYSMVSKNETFDAAIAPFALEMPHSLN
jgi:ApaG protein